MIPWDQRPREIRNLFNPAFCGLVLARGMEGFGWNNNQPMPFTLTLLILPLSLHKQSREIISKCSKTYFVKMLQAHPEIRIGFVQRAHSLFPYTMEAFAYLMSCGTIDINELGCISLRQGTVRKSISGSQDTKDCQTVARLLGRKFAQLNDRITIYTTLGVRP
jgi:NRPS condensation-like uncharacterized protein